MKIIFSRKGFDSQFGKQPSPVLPAGAMLSLPIPRKNDILTFGDIYYNNKSYFDIIKELKPNTTIKANDTCHLDPDIRKNITTPHPDNRVSIFGQCDAALTLLRKFDVKKDDIFLFFGWFKETEYDDNGKLRYKADTPDLHVIYGYLQIGEICNCRDEYPSYVQHHPHVKGSFVNLENNSMYVARDVLSLNHLIAGSGCLTYNADAVLTAEGMTRSKWKPHSFFEELPMTYHSKTSFKGDYFQSAAQGQEFIVEGNEELVGWVKKLIEENGET